MLGAIIGDMVGSMYEFESIKTKDFNIFNMESRMTDDSFLTIAVTKVLMKYYPISYDEKTLNSIKKDLINEFITTCKNHIYAGWGNMFFNWCLSSKHEPYNSFGNGSAMRISPVAYVAKSEDGLKILSKTVTEITHNHPEGIKGAEAIALSIYLSLHGSSKEEIKNRIVSEYYPSISNLNFEELLKSYKFSSRCEDTVPIAIYCFLISDSLEDTIRNAVAIGGDTDTIASMAASIAEAYYQKDKLSSFEEKFLYLKIEPDVEKLIKEFYEMVGIKKFESKINEQNNWKTIKNVSFKCKKCFFYL